MAYIGSNEGWARESYLGIHIGSVHIDLSSVLVDDLDSLLDSFFVNSESRRVGDHESAQLILVLLGFLSEVSQVNFSGFLIRLHCDYAKSDEVCAGWVSSVGGRWNQAEVSVPLSNTFQV